MNEKPVDSTKMLADLKYFDGLVTNQSQRILSQLQSAVANSNEEEGLSSVVISVAECLGELSARVEVIEMALVSGTTSASEPINAKNEEARGEEECDDTESSNVVQLTRLLPEEAIVDSSDMAGLSNFHETEYAHNNLAYNWTGEDSETHVDILVSRDVEKQLRIRIVSTLKQDALRFLTIRIDGQQVTHQPEFDGELSCIVATVPTSEDRTESTRLTLVFTEACTPDSLFDSVDNRYLGLAINSISIGYPVIANADSGSINSALSST